MQGMEVQLPGGLLTNGNLLRMATFQPITGKIEQALIDLDDTRYKHDYVTQVLSTVLARIEDLNVNQECVLQLCMADRQYLMLRLAATLNGEQVWLKATCAKCGGLFDVEIYRSALPVKQAGNGFPFATLQLNKSTIELRVPNAADQHILAHVPEAQAITHLLRSCIRSVDGTPPSDAFFQNLSESDIEEIDSALDNVAPAVCTKLLITCPECQQEQQAELNHYELGITGSYFLYDEIHTLARNYHWSETEILNLPKDRRRLYIDLINRTAGKIEHV